MGFRVVFKTQLITYKALSGQFPVKITELLQYVPTHHCEILSLSAHRREMKCDQPFHCLRAKFLWFFSWLLTACYVFLWIVLLVFIKNIRVTVSLLPRETKTTQLSWSCNRIMVCRMQLLSRSSLLKWNKDLFSDDMSVRTVLSLSTLNIIYLKIFLRKIKHVTVTIIKKYCRAADMPLPKKSCFPHVRKHVCLVQTPTNVPSSWFY